MRVNEEITASRVRLVGENIEEQGIYPITQAMKMADELGLDLVEISAKADPPVCKIIDYQKYLYQQKKKAKEMKSNSAKIVIKEIRFGPNTDEHDFQFKLKHAMEFLQEGAKVKASVFFKGRSIIYSDQGEKLLLTTLPERSRRGTNKRILQVEDAAGSVIAQVDARWILVDTETGRILRRPPEQLDSLWNPEIPYELPQTIHKAETLTSAGIWPASYSRCDINGHINNACYLDIACDALPLEVIQQGPIRSAAVKYHREVPLGQEMEVFWGKTETGWYVMGRREGQASFELEYQW